jgi:hypothetical protein
MSGEIEARPRSETALRHPDGTINFDAYRERARRARIEAIRSSVTVAMLLIGSVFDAGQ